MLTQRLVTAFVLIVILISSIFYLPNDYFSSVIGVFILSGAWEWSKLVNMRQQWQRLFFVLIIFIAGLLLWVNIEVYPVIQDIVLFAAVIWWLLCGAMITGVCSPYKKALCKNAPHKNGCFRLLSKNYLSGVFSGAMVLLPPWLALTGLHANEPYGQELVLVVLLLIAVADSGAYFSGRRWGRKKLAPDISPGKTWEGVWGAAVLVALFSIIVAVTVLDFTRREQLLFFVLCMVTLLFSVLGDLFESVMKRQANLKDSGHILPGHGGILDRIDAMTAAVPVFVSGLIFLKLID